MTKWSDTDPKLEPNPSSEPDRTSLLWLIAAAIATVFLWQVPIGNYLLYPFSILATWFHEMGHGLTAMLLGGRFERLLIFPNGSGLAYHRGFLFLGPIGRALVSAGGPMGPAFAGAAFILASQKARSSRWALILLGSLLILSAVIWVRSAFGLVFVPLAGLGVLAIALLGPNWMQQFSIQFLGVQACISLFHQVDYLFMNRAVIGGQVQLSDSAQIASQLLLPYWFWGGLMVIASLVLLVQSLRVTYRL
ncbi:MAG: M50 family metallopeptidase [Leptolyngbyaceae cyanobacterium bins.59]|nr:M50 family metallopeptidase [Leptolyngbyaceae cyanobacterium bins.59]